VVSDVILIGGLGAAAIGVSLLFWKEFKLLCFDPAFAASMGFRVRALDVLQTSLLVVAIVIGLQTVGVVLMSAMVVAPAAAARQWTNQLSVMMLLAAAFGALSGVMGAVVSATSTGLPTGPTIVLCLTAMVIVSLLVAPQRGVLWRALKHARGRRELRGEGVLLDMLELSRQHEGAGHAHSVAVLDAMSQGRGGSRRTLEELRRRGLVAAHAQDYWSLTPDGQAEAEALEVARARAGVDQE
jgi:manganese/zinc/iron transport system permease protein